MAWPTSLTGQSASEIIAGGATFKLGAYVAAGGATTLLDVGYTTKPIELGGEVTVVDIPVEQSPSFVKSLITEAKHDIQVELAQNSPDLMRIVMQQATGMLTGTSPNQTLKINDPVEEFFQAAILVPGFGTTGADTYSIWKCQVINRQPISFARTDIQKLAFTLRILRDVSSSSGYFWRRVAA